MAIAFDAATDGGNNGGSTTSLTFAHTCTGSDRLLLVGINGDTASDLVTGVTYNGVSMTLVAKQSPGAADTRWTYLYYLIAPASGANNVVASASGTVYLLAGAESYTGVIQTGALDASGTNISAGTEVNTLNSSLTTVADNCWVMFVENGYTENTPPSASTGCTRRTYDATFGSWGLFDSNGPKTPAGSVSVTTTRPTNSNRIIHVLGSFKPAASNKTGRGLTNSKKLSRLSLVG